MPAWKIYKSSRIKAVYNRRKEHDMYILSAQHALIPADKVIEPYNRVMDEKRCQELIPQLKPILKQYDAVVFFKAGARKLYEQCIRTACEQENVKLISFGNGFMGGINDLEKKLRDAENV